MADPQPLTLRPIPSLAEWLGDGSRTEGFEDWVRTMLATEEVVGTPQEATCAKILRALSIACVEGATRQVNEGADAGDVIILTARMEKATRRLSLRERRSSSASGAAGLLKRG